MIDIAKDVVTERSSDIVPSRIPPELEAREPAEVRGMGRDDVRLLVSTGRATSHAHFRQLPDFLRPGDLLVLNASATIPAALTPIQDEDDTPLTLHVSTNLPADLYIVEPRHPYADRVPRQLLLPGGGSAELLTRYRTSQRLWVARLHLPQPFLDYVKRWGRPIAYRHVSARWPIETYQNVYASEPGSAEMPSAGRPFTREMIARLHEHGISTAFVVLHAGVSSPERDEPPYEEHYEVSAEAAAAVRRARRNGGRVIAVGTTVVRALESALDPLDRVAAARGWTDLVISAQRGVRAVDGLITGLHEPTSSHMAMLEAIGGRERVRDAYRAALEHRYLWHEFGDSHLILS